MSSATYQVAQAAFTSEAPPRYRYYATLRSGDSVSIRARAFSTDTQILVSVLGPYRDPTGSGQWQPAGMQGTPTSAPLLNDPPTEYDHDTMGQFGLRVPVAGRYVFVVETDTVLSDHFDDYFSVASPPSPAGADYLAASSAGALERAAAGLDGLEALGRDGDVDRITEGILTLTSQDIASFSYLDDWQLRVQNVVSEIDLYPQRGLAANYLQLLFHEARKPSSVKVHTDARDFVLNIESGAPVVGYDTKLSVQVTPGGALEQALRSSAEGSMTVSWFLRAPSGEITTPYMSLSTSELPETITDPESSWIDPILNDPAGTALAHDYRWDEAGEHEVIVLFAWRSQQSRGNHFIKQRVDIVDRDTYLRRANSEAGVNHADEVLSVFEQRWWWLLHENRLEHQRYADLLLQEPSSPRDELAFNGGQDWNDPDWHREVALPARDPATSMADLGGGKLRLERDGTVVSAHYYVWTPALGYYEQAQTDAVATAADFGLYGVRNDVLVARASWDASYDNHVAVDEFDFRTSIPGDYVVLAQPVDGGPVGMRYVSVSSGEVYDAAHSGYEHAQAWRKRYNALDGGAFRLDGPGEHGKTTKLLPLQASHLADDGTLEIIPLFAAKQFRNNRWGWVVYDLRPGQDDTEFRGSDGAKVYEQAAVPNTHETLAGAIHDFEQGNNLVEGTIRIEWNPRRVGIADAPPAQTWTFATYGKTNRQRIAAGASWAGLGGTALGLMATGAALPVAALWLFTSAALSGSVSSMASIIDNLEKDKIQERRLVVDIAGLIASFVGALAGAGAVSYQVFRSSLAKAPVRLAGRSNMLLLRAQQIRGLAQLDYAVSLGELFVITEDAINTIYKAGKDIDDVNERSRQIRIAITNLVTSAAFFAVGSGPRADESLPAELRGPKGRNPRKENGDRVVKRRVEGRLFARGGTSMHDVRQGFVPNCRQMAEMAGLAEYPDYIRRHLSYDEARGVFVVTRPTKWNNREGRWETEEIEIDNEFWSFHGRVASADYGRDQSVWPIVLEEAYRRPQMREAGPGEMFSSWASLPAQSRTRPVGSRDELRATFLTMSPGRVMLLGSTKTVSSRGLVGRHAYTVVSYDPVTELVTLRNPWGYRHPPPMTLDEVIADFRVLSEYSLLRDALPGGHYPDHLVGDNIEWARQTFENAMTTARLAGRDYSTHLDALSQGAYLGTRDIDLSRYDFDDDVLASLRAGRQLHHDVSHHRAIEQALRVLIDNGECSAIVFTRVRQNLFGEYPPPSNGDDWHIAWGTEVDFFRGAMHGRPDTRFEFEYEFEWHLLPN